MPANEETSPRLDHLPKDQSKKDSKGYALPQPGLIVNGSLCVKDQILFGEPGKTCEASTSLNSKIKKMDEVLKQAEEDLRKKINKLKGKIQNINTQIQRFNSL